MAFSIDNILSSKPKTTTDILPPTLPKYEPPFASPHITAASTINRDYKASHFMSTSAHHDTLSSAAFLPPVTHAAAAATAGLLLAHQQQSLPHPALTSSLTSPAAPHPAAGLFSPTSTPWKIDPAELLYHNLYIDSILQGNHYFFLLFFSNILSLGVNNNA